jgi:hypothetical protein
LNTDQTLICVNLRSSEVLSRKPFHLPRANSTVVTLDRHFRIYRKNGRLVIPTLMPE